MTAQQVNGYIGKAATAVLVGLVLFMIQAQWTAINKLRETQAQHETKDASSYITRGELKEAISELKQTLREAVIDAGRSTDRPR